MFPENPTAPIKHQPAVRLPISLEAETSATQTRSPFGDYSGNLRREVSCV